MLYYLNNVMHSLNAPVIGNPPSTPGKRGAWRVFVGASPLCLARRVKD